MVITMTLAKNCQIQLKGQNKKNVHQSSKTFKLQILNAENIVFINIPQLLILIRIMELCKKNKQNSVVTIRQKNINIYKSDVSQAKCSMSSLLFYLIFNSSYSFFWLIERRFQLRLCVCTVNLSIQFEISRCQGYNTAVWNTKAENATPSDIELIYRNNILLSAELEIKIKQQYSSVLIMEFIC